MHIDDGPIEKRGRNYPELHVDFVGHDWSRLREYLIERRSDDEPNAGKSGDYAHYSEPHSMGECPFNDKEGRFGEYTKAGIVGVVGCLIGGAFLAWNPWGWFL